MSLAELNWAGQSLAPTDERGWENEGVAAAVFRRGTTTSLQPSKTQRATRDSNRIISNFAQFPWIESATTEDEASRIGRCFWRRSEPKRNSKQQQQNKTKKRQHQGQQQATATCHCHTSNKCFNWFLIKCLLVRRLERRQQTRTRRPTERPVDRLRSKEVGQYLNSTFVCLLVLLLLGTCWCVRSLVCTRMRGDLPFS